VEEKLNLLLKSVSALSSKQDALANRHKASQGELNSKLKKEDYSQRVRLDLMKAGLVGHSAKCSRVPSHQTNWLGFSLDLKQGMISIAMITIAKEKQ